MEVGADSAARAGPMGLPWCHGSPCVATAALGMAACAGRTLLAAHGRWKSPVEAQSLCSGFSGHSLMCLIGSGGRTRQNNSGDVCICQRRFYILGGLAVKRPKRDVCVDVGRMDMFRLHHSLVTILCDAYKTGNLRLYENSPHLMLSSSSFIFLVNCNIRSREQQITHFCYGKEMTSTNTEND